MKIESRKVLNGPNIVRLVLLVSGLIAAGIELGIGAACLLALLRTRDSNTHYVPTRRIQ